MKLEPRHVIAAPFFAFAAVLAFDFARNLETTAQRGWINLCLMLVLSSFMIGVAAVPGYLALKRRWEEFVKIIGVVVAITLFSLISNHTRALGKAADDLVGNPYPLLGAFWGLAVTVSPFVIAIVSYRRLVPLVIRRIDPARRRNFP